MNIMYPTGYDLHRLFWKNGAGLFAGWWFGTFFIFPYIGNNHPNWLIFFRGVQTTNQICLVFHVILHFGLFKDWKSSIVAGEMVIQAEESSFWMLSQPHQVDI